MQAAACKSLQGTCYWSFQEPDPVKSSTAWVAESWKQTYLKAWT